MKPTHDNTTEPRTSLAESPGSAFIALLREEAEAWSKVEAALGSETCDRSTADLLYRAANEIEMLRGYVVELEEVCDSDQLKRAQAASDLANVQSEPRGSKPSNT